MSTERYKSKTLSSACGIFAFLFLVPAIGTWISAIDKYKHAFGKILINNLWF